MYPVTTPFGQVPGYPLNNGFHNGIDYGYPMGTPVVVNGVTIGLSNNTGATTGPHLHVGKYVNGQVQNPGVGNGFSFSSAVVYDTGSDSSDGNFVRITGDGALWNYLHLEKTLVTKGQVLKGDNMLDQGGIVELYQAALFRSPNQGEIDSWLGKDYHELVHSLNVNNADLKNKAANFDQIYAQLQALQNQPAAQQLAAIKKIIDG